METKFSIDSRMGRLWDSMKLDALVADMGLEELESNADEGFLGGIFPFENRRIGANDDLIESGEVLELAYSDRRFHRTLARHGFPVTFAMDDFDDSTTVDDEWRAKISGEVDRIKAELDGSTGFKAGSDAWRAELARRIHSSLRKTVDWTGDCKLESPDWKALTDRCGTCTEMSTIMYFALDRAGLAPSFFFAKDAKPSIGALTRIAQANTEVEYHALTGIALDNGKYLYVDLVFPEAFSADRYPFNPRAITVRQFAAMQLQQRTAEELKASLEPDSDSMLEIAPDNIHYSYLALNLRVQDLSEKEFLRQVAAMEKIEAKKEIADYYSTLIRMMYSAAHKPGMKQDESKLLALIEGLASTNADMAALAYYQLAQMQIPIIEGMEQKIESGKDGLERDAMTMEARDVKISCLILLSRSIIKSPLWFRPIQLLDKLAARWLSSANRRQIYRQLAAEQPDHSHFRYMLAMACEDCLNAISLGDEDEEDCGTRDELQKELIESTRQIAHRLEPDFAAARLLLGRAYLMTNRQRNGIAEIKKGISLIDNDGNESPDALMGNMLIALYQGKRETLLNSIEKLKSADPKGFISMIYFALENSISCLLTPGGDARKDIVRQFGMIQDLIEKLDEDGENYRVENLKVAYGVYALIFMRGDKSVADGFFSSIRDPEAANVQGSYANLMKSTVAPAFRSSDMKGDKLRRALDLTKYIEGKMIPGKKETAAPAYLAIARHAILQGKADYAKDALDAAVEAGGKSAPEALFKELCVDLFTGCLDAEVPMKLRQRDFTALWLALDLMWQHKGSFAPEFKAKLKDAYNNAITISEDMERKDLAATALLRYMELLQ